MSIGASFSSTSEVHKVIIYYYYYYYYLYLLFILEGCIICLHGSSFIIRIAFSHSSKLLTDSLRDWHTVFPWCSH